MYDIADLYKVDITIPLAFDLVSEQVPDISTAARRGIRDRMKDGKFMQRCVHDIRSLLLETDGGEAGAVRASRSDRSDTGVIDDDEASAVEVEDITAQLWAGASGYRAGGCNYGRRDDGEPLPDVAANVGTGDDGGTIHDDDAVADDYETDEAEDTLREEFRGEAHQNDFGAET
ncbi:hypothetical protein [Bifidobacterium santillanense]|uniref:hypothetical protein n=1 Tax=Bifidobacterium santillanense TaxID=2809028 RepID=UPI001F0AD48D|nr:hypothetical protein [Bifidobacterium santillanense]